jgi:hypothetical protein
VRREREAHLKAIMDNAPASIVFKDLDGHFLLANQVFLDRFALTAAEAAGKTSTTSAAGRSPRRPPPERQVLETGRPQVFEIAQDFDGTGCGPDGLPLPGDGRGRQAAGLGSIGVDVTESKQSRAGAGGQRAPPGPGPAGHQRRPVGLGSRQRPGLLLGPL